MVTSYKLYTVETMDFLRRIFGIPDQDDFSRFSRNNPAPNSESFINRDDTPRDEFPRKGFDIFTDPFQMQQYFEQEMNEMLKRFGFQGIGDFSFDHPSIEHPSGEFGNTPYSSLRDQFLKNGYEKPSKRNSDKVDQDLDAKVKSGDLDSILSGEFDKQISPYEMPQSKSFFYGTSHTMKTVTNPDGSVETHHTTRDNQGNEETTICHKIGEKEYCVMTKKDKSGKEEVTEQFVNMDASEKDLFLKSSKPKINSGTDGKFPFDKFFK
ncbi:unnamed protein product [Phaedon cochleariae]|uniref:HCLS1-associated protein X-1 n=1 Tax=Phaedon cochleariae TaxID=80249 RepID=A0A9N9SIS3_PHACE|nr:unnamed protein product [Phaedon cochleariae]